MPARRCCLAPPRPAGIYDVMKVLGKGGTGETWLCRDMKTDELLAVKLIKRPIPKPVVPMIMHEIQVRCKCVGEGGQGALRVQLRGAAS